jgi:uncharacterized protein with gpF-like domain
MLDVLEARVARTWQREITRAMRAAAAEYSSTQSIMLAMGEHKGRVDRIVRLTYETAAQQFAKPYYRETKSFDDFLRSMQVFMSTVGAKKVVQISETTEHQIRRAVNQGLADGEGVDGIAKIIRQRAPEIARARSAVIARTESHTSAMWAQVESIKDLDLGLRKQWITVQDDRTRQDHIDADGQTVGMDEAFLVGDNELMFPGDPDGQAEQVINCRCVMNFVE